MCSLQFHPFHICLLSVVSQEQQDVNDVSGNVNDEHWTLTHDSHSNVDVNDVDMMMMMMMIEEVMLGELASLE